MRIARLLSSHNDLSTPRSPSGCSSSVSVSTFAHGAGSAHDLRESSGQAGVCYHSHGQQSPWLSILHPKIEKILNSFHPHRHFTFNYQLVFGNFSRHISQKEYLGHYYRLEVNMGPTTQITKNELRRRAGLLNVSEAARYLGINPRQFRYRIDSRGWPQPSIRIGSKPRRYYSQEALEQLQRLLAQKR